MSGPSLLRQMDDRIRSLEEERDVFKEWVKDLESDVDKLKAPFHQGPVSPTAIHNLLQVTDKDGNIVVHTWEHVYRDMYREQIIRSCAGFVKHWLIESDNEHAVEVAVECSHALLEWNGKD